MSGFYIFIRTYMWLISVAVRLPSGYYTLLERIRFMERRVPPGCRVNGVTRLPKVSLIRYTLDGEKLVAVAAKQSLSRRGFHYQWEKMGWDEVDVWIRETWRRGHFSPWEHSVYTWAVEGCSRSCSHQLVRHRIASYTQLSLRYAQLGFDPRCIRELSEAGSASFEVAGVEAHIARTPEGAVAWSEGSRAEFVDAGNGMVRLVSLDADPGDLSGALVVSVLYDAWDGPEAPPVGSVFGVDSLFRRPCRMIDFVYPPSMAVKKDVLAWYVVETSRAMMLYRYMLSRGIRGEDARLVIPMGIQTKLVVTMNARELVTSFLPLRMCTRAQWEIRTVAWLLWRELVRVHPRLFRYAGPRCVFSENIVRSEPIGVKEIVSGAPLRMEACPEGVPARGVAGCVLSAVRLVEKLGGGKVIE